MKRKRFFKKVWPLAAVAIFLGLMVVFIEPLFAKDIIIAPGSTDRVGIGTATAPQYMLDIAGSGRFTGDLLIPTPTASVGIGTADPSVNLQIGSDAINPTILLESTSSGDNATDQSAGIEFGESPSARGSIWYTGDGNMHIGMNNRTREHMRFSYSANSAWLYGNLYLNGASNNTYFPGSGIWNSSGSVGIGTTAPAYKLDVSGTGRFTGALIVPTPSASSHAATKGYVDSVAGTGGISGSGTTNYIPKWSSASGLTNSRISDTGTGNVVVSAVLQATSFSGNATSATNADYATNAGYAASAGTAGALSSTSLCSSGYYARGITTSGTASGCTAVPTGGHGDGTNCSTGYFATGVDASGNAQGCANSIANSTNADYATNAGYAASAGTAGALSSTSLCSSGYYARGITTSGTASGCTAVPTGGHGNGTNCSAGYYARGVDASGNAEDCTAVPTGGHGDGTNCSTGYYPLGVDANGNVQSCTAVPTGGHSNGANCAAGSFPLGVDANGAAESCTSLTNGGFSPAFGTVTATSYLYSSDAKLKTNIKTIKKPLEKITALRGVTFKWKDSKEPSMGLIAQEVEKVFPELVETSGQYKAVEYGNLVAPLIEAVKAQQVQIEALEARIADLESNR